MKMPQEIGPIHFIGIGGIGMSGIAEILHGQNYIVRGSDMVINANVKRLQNMGIKVELGQREENIRDAAVVVISSAIKKDNPELRAARRKKIPIVRRAEMLAEIMRFKNAIAVGGTHGKTTTTSLIAALLEAAGLDPTVINGGIINAYGTNAREGKGEWMVVEADESDGTFVKLPAEIAIVTNIDPEHLDYYGSFAKMKDAYLQFVENVPFYGFALMCLDHPQVQSLVGKITDRRVITYGENPQADVRLCGLKNKNGVSHFSIKLRDRISNEEKIIENIKLPMPGLHNALNATAAIAIADQLDIDKKHIIAGLENFTGVKRRFTKVGEVNGINIIDDYGHHPVEISAALRAGRSSTKENLIAIVQPHRYSRLRDLFDDFASCFNDADSVIVTPVFAAGEEPIEGVNHIELARKIRALGHRDVQTINEASELAPLLAKMTNRGDYVIFLGAGNITYWANELPEKLTAILNEDANG